MYVKLNGEFYILGKGEQSFLFDITVIQACSTKRWPQVNFSSPALLK